MVNIVEIVNKLPIGTKLYSTICGECTIKKIYEGLGFDVISKDGTTYNFSYDGRFDFNGECCIFTSKENRDWNAFSKVKPKFKMGDKIVHKNSLFKPLIITGVYSDYYVLNLSNKTELLDIKYQDEWELAFDSKFKVGDKIVRENTVFPILTVTFVNDMIYTVKSNISNEEHDIGVKIVENNYKIATFSPSDLKPFDRLLVKRHNTWQIAHFGYFKNGVVFTEMGQPCNIDVVPYNDETKHLLGTCDDYYGFYKWWE